MKRNHEKTKKISPISTQWIPEYPIRKTLLGKCPFSNWFLGWIGPCLTGIKVDPLWSDAKVSSGQLFDVLKEVRCVHGHNLECVSQNGHFSNLLFTKTDKSWNTYPTTIPEEIKNQDKELDCKMQTGEWKACGKYETSQICFEGPTDRHVQ